MNLTEDQKTQVKDLASVAMEPREVAIILGIEEHVFEDELKNNDSEIYLAYHQGYLQAKAEVNKSIMSLASAGSAPAQNLVIQKFKAINFILDE